MAFCKHVVTINAYSGLPKDIYQNTFHTNGTAAALAQAITFAGRLQTFYNSVPTGGSSRLSSYMSGALNSATVKVATYNMDEPSPRPPVAIAPLTWTIASGSRNMPTEVALCLSYQGVKVPGQLQSRRRGRVYIGPFTEAANSGTATTKAVPSALLISDLAKAGKQLAAASDGACDWVVYSTVSGDKVVVSDGWVDNAWDIQRRRGELPTARTVFP
jgi:hypothetical protein